MRPLLAPEEMARADRATIDSGTAGAVLMERAGRAVARAVIRVIERRYGARAAVVCGKGNNGGDGFVAARVLRAEGMAVRCLFVGDESSVAGYASHHLDEMRRRGVALEPFDRSRLSGADVVVDALFGTGFYGSAEGPAAEAIEAVNSSGARVVAVDIPSGVNGATGAVEGSAINADVTVAMAAEKIGTAIAAGAVHAGGVEVADIGIAVGDARVHMSERTDVASVLPTRPPDAHKRTLGAIALIGGSAGMSGAVILAARAALRAGAGYLTAGVTRSVDDAISSALPEALSDVVTEGTVLGPEALDAFAGVLARADAVALGPGLGRGDPQSELVRTALAKIELPLVLDADGLNVVAGSTDALSHRTAPTVITPHPAELGRLMERSTGEIQADRLGAATEAAQRFGCVVALKGFRTLIAEPGGKVVVNPTGGPELATAGTGDVLTGATAALLAAGLDDFAAAWAAAYIHGVAGSIAAQRIGDSGVVAGDVAEALPAAVAFCGGK